MKTKIILSAIIFSLVMDISLAADKPQINWFNATSPAERNGQQVLLEWNLSGGNRSVLTINCERGKINLQNPAGRYPYDCGEALNYSNGQGTYALALAPKNNSQWADVLFTLSLFNDSGAIADEKSFQVGFQPSRHLFERDLYFGLREDVDVIELQKTLTKEKFYSGPANGNFLAMTLAAVKQYQKKKGVKDSGFVGKITRSRLNQ